MNGAIPFVVRRVLHQVDRGGLLIGHLDPCGIGTLVEFQVDGERTLGFRSGNQVQCDFVTYQSLTLSIYGDK